MPLRATRVILPCGLVSALLLLQGVAEAQPPSLSVPSLPVTLTMHVDDAAQLATANPLTYRATVDGGSPIAFVTTKPAPCTDCATAPLTVMTAGVHTISVTATNGTATGPALVQTFTVSIAIAQPVAPSKLTFTLTPVPAPPPPDLPAPSATDLPPATSLIDTSGGTWTRSATPVTCPLATQTPTQCYRILRNGVASGIGYELYLRSSNGRIYRHAPDGQWYEFQPADGSWWTWGPTKPPA